VKVIDIAQVIHDSIGLKKIPAMAGAPADTAGTTAEVHQPGAGSGGSELSEPVDPSAPQPATAANDESTEPKTETLSGSDEPAVDTDSSPTDEPADRDGTNPAD